MGTGWVYEILDGQTYGCTSCRFIFFGCKACRKPGHRGRNAAQMCEDPKYQEGLAALSDEPIDDGGDSVDGDATASWENPKAKRGRKSK